MTSSGLGRREAFRLVPRSVELAYGLLEGAGGGRTSSRAEEERSV